MRRRGTDLGLLALTTCSLATCSGDLASPSDSDQTAGGAVTMVAASLTLEDIAAIQEPENRGSPVGRSRIVDYVAVAGHFVDEYDELVTSMIQIVSENSGDALRCRDASGLLGADESRVSTRRRLVRISDGMGRN